MLAALLACGAWTAPQRGQQIFRSGVQTVFVDVSVLKGHTPVTDLSATEFMVSDNGVPQRVEVVTDTPIPLDVSLVVNASQVNLYYGVGGRTPGVSDEAQRNVRQIASALRADDRLGIVTFASDVVETRPMTPIGSNPEVISLGNPMTDALSNRYRITEALLTALTRPVLPDRRHLVVVFALGTGTPSIAPLEHLVTAARRSDALLYGVLAPTHRETRTNQPFAFYPSEVVIRDAVTQAAEATGGKAYFTGDIIGAFRDVLREFRRSYVLRYTLEGVATAGWHDIVVTVPTCSTCTIRARRGYMGQ
jgi:hypothetical protein